MHLTKMFTKTLTFLGLKPRIIDGMFECDSSIEVKESTNFVSETPCFNCQNDNIKNDKIVLFNDYKQSNIKHIVINEMVFSKNKTVNNFKNLYQSVPCRMHHRLMKKSDVFKKPSFLPENESEKVTHPKRDNITLNDQKLIFIENIRLEIKNAKLEERNKLLTDEIKHFELIITQQEDKSIKLYKENKNLKVENSIIQNDFKNVNESLDYLKMLNEKLTESNGKELYEKSVCKIQDKPLKSADSREDKRNRDTLYESSWPNAPPKTSSFCENATSSVTSKKNNENFSLRNDMVNFNEDLVCFKIKQFKMLSPYELSDNISISTFLGQFPKERFSMCSQQEYCTIIHQFLSKELKDKMAEMGVIPCKINFQDYLYHLYYLKEGLFVSEHDVLHELENLKLKGHNLLEKYERIVNLVDKIDPDIWPEKTKCRYISYYCKKHMDKSLKPVFEMLHNDGKEDYPSRVEIKRFMVKNMKYYLKDNLNTKQPKNLEQKLNIVNEGNFEEYYRKNYLKLKRKSKKKILV